MIYELSIISINKYLQYYVKKEIMKLNPKII